ncbi:MAG: cardiolipin synthase [Dehalobacterium formicoaceticum]
MQQKNWMRKLFRTRFLVAFFILLQLIVITVMITGSVERYAIIYPILTLVSVIVVLHIMNKKSKPAYKLLWVIQIALFPIFGSLFYLLSQFQSSNRKLKNLLADVEQGINPLFIQDEETLKRIHTVSKDHLPQINYLQGFVGFPVYQNTQAEYLPTGEETHARMLEELDKAEKFIFMEYFIIKEGVMWNSILDILQKKVQQGVEVRVMYDDMGCFLKLPIDFHKVLEGMGIQCVVFNPFRPVLSTLQNNRDHRKITVIDGKTAFTGGINLADEYINEIDLHGHWKDNGIMVQGAAVWSFTLMFLHMWNLSKETTEDYTKYRADGMMSMDSKSDGFFLPYGDSPLDTENVGEHIYLQMINNAKRYLYICTPYLIVDDDMISALSLAAKSGVDVRIITPHRHDRWFVHHTTRSYYRELISSGVRIYEYTDGFIHSKTFISDDSTATVGTINLDFRSLYLHFECGLWIHKSGVLKDILKDFLDTLESCHEVTREECDFNIALRLMQDVFRIFAPLM